MTHSPEYLEGFAAAVEAAAKVADKLGKRHAESADMAANRQTKEVLSFGASTSRVIAKRIRALSPGDGWCRDMDAAPKDGAYILAWVNGAPEIIFWSQHTGNGWTDGNPERGVAPTAWRHLSEPPREGDDVYPR